MRTKVVTIVYLPPAGQQKANGLITTR